MPRGRGARQPARFVRCPAPAYGCGVSASHDDDPSFIVANLETMVIRAQTNKTIPVVGTIPPNFRHDPTAQDIIDSANTLIRRMAQSHHIVVAEIFERGRAPRPWRAAPLLVWIDTS